jgi:phage shock protein A
VSFWGRLRLLLGIRAEHALDEAEDPRQTLDYAYAKQLELQQKMRRGVADVATSKKRIELQARQLGSSVDKLEGQARLALQQQREDLAREALTRRAMVRNELEELQEQQTVLAAEEAKLLEAARRLDLQIQQFRTRKEAVKATYTAAQARARVGESVAGLDRDDSELLLAVQRAEDKIANTQARADALEGLMASGALEDASVSRDALQRELTMGATQAEVTRELARLQGEAADQKKALEDH